MFETTTQSTVLNIQRFLIKSMDVVWILPVLAFGTTVRKNDFNETFTFERQAYKPMKLLTFGKTKHEGGLKMIFFP